MSEIVPAAVPVKVKLPGAPLGSVCFSTMIEPRFVFVKTHVTVSPGSSSMLAGVSVSPMELEQITGARSQPAGTVSVTE